MEEALDNKFDQILCIDKHTEKFESENQVVPYLRMVTSYRYGIEISQHRKWGNQESAVETGTFYQIIPDRVDNGFFDWYCDNRPYHQLFITVEMALLYFIFYWQVWMKQQEAAKG